MNEPTVEITREGDYFVLRVHCFMEDRIGAAMEAKQVEQAIRLISDNMIARAKAFVASYPET